MNGMLELNEDNLRDYLIALGDGELTAAEAADVWAYLAESPGTAEHLHWMHEQQQLTAAAKHALNEPLPPEVRARVAAVLATQRVAGVQGTVVRRWRPALAVAAGILLGVGGVALYRAAGDGRTVVPAALVADVSRVHSECARLPEDLHSATFESVDAGLAAATLADLGGKSAAPDLSTIGYHLVGAGPCPAAKFGTVHVLYHNDGPKPYHAVSLFVQADQGQCPRLRAGHVYRVSSADMPFPVLAWRGRGVLYFLLADNDRIEADALNTVHPTPATGIVTVAAR